MVWWRARRMSAAVVALAVLASLAMVDSVQSQPAPTDDPAQKVIDLQRAKRAADVSPDRLIIVYDAAGTADSVARARLRQSVRAQLLRSDHGGSREVVRVLSANAAAVAAQLKQSPLVVDAYPDHVVSLTLTPDDPLFPQQWDLPKISAPTAWDTTEGNNAAVAVLDCGVHSNHPDLNGQVVLESNFSAAGTTDDLCNHGTHVAGTIAAIIDNGVGVAGVAPRAHLLNGKVLDDTGSGFLSDVESGIEWAADNGANVVNMSLGAPIACDTGMQQAVNYAWNKGVVVVAAAGNSGTSGAASPGSCNNVIAVAATDSNDAKPNWSNFGANVSLAAPGVNIVSTVNPADNGGNLYASLSGTSMAAPHVSALAALVWSSTYGSSASAVRDRMFSTADKISGTGSLWTYGRIDAAAAVAPATPTGAPAPAAVVQPLAAPVRIADTRSSGGPIASGSQRCFAIAGQAGIPVDAAGVVLNVTAIGYSSQGWITIYPAGQVAPTTSTLNFDPAVYAVANGSIIPLSNGQVCAAVGTVIPGAGSAHVLLDVTAYIPSASAAAMPLLSTPQRVADTRANGGAPVPTGSGRCFTVTGTPGIGSDAGAVLLNVTAVGYGTRGWLTIYAAGQTAPATSTVNFDPSVYAVANETLVGVGAGGQVCVQVGTVNGASGGAHIVLDAFGYETTAAETRLPMLGTPQRVLDTRSSGGAIANGATRCTPVAGQGSVPSNAQLAVLNVTVVGSGSNGWVTVYPAGQSVPSTSTVNFDLHEYAVANTALMPLGANGQVCIYVGTVENAAGSAQVVLDVMGYQTP